MPVNPITILAKPGGPKAPAIGLFASATAVPRFSVRGIPRNKLHAIRSLHRREDRRNVVRILFFFNMWAGAGYTALVIDSPIVQVLSCLAITASLIGFTVLLHEASHRLLFKNSVLNEGLGFLCGLPIVLSVSGFRTNHLAHHERRGSTTDIAGTGSNFRDSTTATAFYCLSIFIRAYGFILYLPYVGLTQGSWYSRAKTFLEYALIAASCVMMFRLIPAEMILKLWLVPLLIAAHLTELRAVAEHGFTARGNVFTATRTVMSNRVVSFLMCNINYHLEHHIFPAVPWYNLPKVHNLLQDEYRRRGCSVYRSYTQFFVDFLKVSRKGIISNARLILSGMRQEA